MAGEHILWLGFLTAFFVVLLATPSLIKVAKLKHLVDEPSEERKLHTRSVPTIGGITIFGAIVFSYSLWFPDEFSYIENALINFKTIVASLILLFFVGVKDDIIGTAPMKKLAAHFIVGFIIVIMANIRIESMHNIFGINELDLWQSYIISIFTYIVIVNAYNLIDGLDGLAGGIGFISSVSFGLLFAFSDNIPLALLSFVLSGALLGFLIFNFSPARIFMGDSGSLTIGAIISVLVFNAINIPHSKLPELIQDVNLPILVISILVYPLADTIRAFTLRAFKGTSPFTADKNHIHHKFIGIGFNHAKTVITLYIYNLVIIAFAVFIRIPNATLNLFILIGIALSISIIPSIIGKISKK
ncbi:MAG: undecaprenyl/decaprenyl-phosphate alpha-N-acetylglucosaminyl 1-phosphate transferase [Flavobacteriales bacterium]|jgi:UDP-N-acetylmuramyl pentapeptide phosphotransferase/UDP-N-acetylglucosamine-1-phosphate transferase|nr:undecaprenyl/decaprenyl-phosphate alpha-N-acetylglucosaminyl 1-phosphate transferase [Flavobacteriales bacterium]